MAIEDRAPLNEARGDVNGITSQDGLNAYIAGGFTNLNNFCAPLPTIEKYDFKQNVWTYLPNLLIPRGEIVLGEINDNLYAVGGERQIDGICNITTKGAGVGKLTVATQSVEEYVEADRTWVVAANYPYFEFRFAGVSLFQKQLVYAFGGQTAFNAECACFKTSNEIAVLGEKVSGAGTYRFSFLAGIMTFLLGWELMV